MKKIFTFLFALAASVGMSWATTYVTITQNDFPESGHSFTKDGVTVSAGNIDGMEGHLMNGGSFSTTLGNFTKIEVNAGDVDISGEGWSGDNERQTWTGNASSVSFSGDIRSKNQGVTIMFTIGDPAPTYTVALKDGTVNADKVTLSATSAVEGATITVTPNEEYEITAFSAYYVVIDGQLGSINEIDATLNPETGAYSFTMPAYAVTIEATIALKPVPEGDVFAGFTATAGSGGFDNEGHACLVDNKFISSDWTKWCANDDKKSVPTGESEKCWWLDFAASAALNLTGYILTTGNDTGSEHGRNPKNWLLKAKLNADDAWTTIATVTNDVTMKNQSFKDYKFFVDQSGPYQYFRFEVFANQGAGVMQLCELRLIGTEAPEPEPVVNLKLIEFQVPASWENDNTPISIADFPDFVATTYEIASALPVTSEPSLVVFDFPGDDEMSVYSKMGGEVSKSSTGTIYRKTFFENTQVHYYYPVLAGDAPTAVENVQTNQVQGTKILRNGQLLIIRDGKTYTIIGTMIQ